MAESAPGWSLYRAFLCNPIYWVDPTGANEDDYGLSQEGHVTLLEKTDDENDRLIVLDEKGNKTDKTIEVKKGVLNNIKSDNDSENNTYNYMTIVNDDEASNLFEFVSQNTNVEWSQVKFRNMFNYISTSHQPHSDGSGAHLAYKLIVQGSNLREHIHSHPTSTEGPSGFKPSEKIEGDRKFAEWMHKYRPEVSLKVFERKTKKYIEYNDKKIINK